MGTNYAPLFVGLFLFCYVRDFMMSLSGEKQVDIDDAVVSKIYPAEQLNKANTSYTKSKKGGKDQILTQSSTAPDPGIARENDKNTIKHHKQEQRGQPSPSR